MQALEENRDLAEVLFEKEGVTSIISREEIAELLDPRKYIGTAVEQVERLDRKLRPLLE
jgi:adenylosuccinate lyase